MPKNKPFLYAEGDTLYYDPRIKGSEKEYKKVPGHPIAKGFMKAFIHEDAKHFDDYNKIKPFPENDQKKQTTKIQAAPKPKEHERAITTRQESRDIIDPYSYMTSSTRNGQSVKEGTKMPSVEYQFSEWLRRFHPGLFMAAKKRAQAKNGNGLGQNHPAISQAVWQDAGVLPNFVPNAPTYVDTISRTNNKNDNGGWLKNLGQSAMDLLKEAGPIYLQSKAQKDIFEAQLKRAEKGLPPLETSQIAPTVRVETDVGEQVERFTTGISSTLQKAMIFGGLGLGVYFLFFHGNK